MSSAKRTRSAPSKRSKSPARRSTAGKPPGSARRGVRQSAASRPAKTQKRPAVRPAAPVAKPIPKPVAKPVAKPAAPAKPARPAAKPAKPAAAPAGPVRTAAAKPPAPAPRVSLPLPIAANSSSKGSHKPAAPPPPKAEERPAADKPAPAAKKPKPPAKTMQVPLPETAPLLKLQLPDVRRAAVAPKGRTEAAHGHLRPEPTQRPRESSDEDGPVDASLMMSSLSVDVHPKIEDNYDYSVLDEFRSSRSCPPPTRMVNTGCGGGEAAVYFAKLGFKVVGIDADRAAVGLARERAWLAGCDVDFMVGDLFETPNLLPAESFGLAVDRGAFYRLEDDRDRQRYLANIRRLLFQGGVLLLSAGFFPLEASRGKEKKAPRTGTKLLLAREGGVVVNELRQAGFDLLHRVLRRTSDSGDYGELLLHLKK